MKAIQILEHGNSDVLRISDIDEPECPPNKVKIKVKACAINHLDIWVRNGLPGLPITLPLILGSDASGTIVECGEQIRKYNIGDDVVVQPGTYDDNCYSVKKSMENYSKSYGILGETENGVQAEYIVLKEKNIYKKPAILSHEEASSMQLVFMTSYQMLIERAKLNKEDSILIYGATSGIGSAAIQIAKNIGAKVIATVGCDTKKDYASEMGADYVLNHYSENLTNEIKNITKNEGCNVIFEHIGNKTWSNSMKVLSIGGRLVTCGSTTGPNVSIDLRYLFMKQQSILGSTMSNINSFNKVMEKIDNGIYTPFLDRIFKFNDIKKAHNHIESRKHHGKVVIVP